MNRRRLPALARETAPFTHPGPSPASGTNSPMDPSQKPSGPTDKNKKPAPQGGNYLWYLLGLGVLLLLMVTLLSSKSQFELDWSDLVRLVKQSEPGNPKVKHWIEVEDDSSKPPQTFKVSNLTDLVVGPAVVSGKVDGDPRAQRKPLGRERRHRRTERRRRKERRLLHERPGHHRPGIPQAAQLAGHPLQEREPAQRALQQPALDRRADRHGRSCSSS